MLTDKAKIDAVIAWVDGADLIHRRKVDFWRKQLSPESQAATSDRFVSHNELEVCVYGIMKNMDFVGRIFIVTDNQDPFQRFSLLENYRDRITVIDHAEILNDSIGLVRPTFNSHVIEANLWKIKELSNIFLYFNDDFFLINKITPNDLISGNTLILNVQKRNHAKVCSEDLPKNSLRQKILLNTLELLRKKYSIEKFYMPRHYPYILNKKIYAEMSNEFKQELACLAIAKFRTANDFWPVLLHYNYALMLGEAEVDFDDRGIFYAHDTFGKIEDIETDFIERSKDAIFLCINNWSAFEKRAPKVLRMLEEKVGIRK